jgi:hypothetical protein
MIDSVYFCVIFVLQVSNWRFGILELSQKTDMGQTSGEVVVPGAGDKVPCNVFSIQICNCSARRKVFCLYRI